MTKNEALAEYLRGMLNRHNISAREMSEKAGLANNAVSSIIRGDTNPTPYTLKQLADTWGTEADYLSLMHLAGHLHLSPDLILSPEEADLLHLFRKLEVSEQKRILQAMRSWVEDK